MKKNLLIVLLACLACLTGSQKAFALDQVDGVYQIGSAQDLEAFSNVVASGSNTANAVLTADIDMSGVDHQPIGSTSSIYKGTFDGQEHYIRNMVIELVDVEYVGLFGVVGDGAYIKNVIIDSGCSISGSAFVGGIAGGTNGGGTATFENCGNEGMVSAANQNAAGICGVSMGSACGIVMKNCFNTGGITGGREAAALCGWVGDRGSSITNCYNTGFIIGMDGSYSLWRNTNGKGLNNFDSYGNQGTQITDDEYELSTGSVCYLLNGNKSDNVTWYQKLGEDTHPVPFASHGVVYAVGDLYCDGSSKGGDLTFSNSNESNRDPHAFVDGICSACGDVDPNYLPLTDGYYELSNATQLNWFAALVNHSYKKVNARLTADIDFSEYTKNDVMIGGVFEEGGEEGNDAKAFEGIFDGQGHKITVNYNVSYDACALFKMTNNATIRNLMIDGNIESTQRFVGGLGFVSRGTCLYENIVVAVNIKSDFSGDGTHGGIFAVCHEAPTFRNCAFVGTMDASLSEGSAAIIGYAHGNVETKIENCYVASTDLWLAGNSTVIARHVNNIINCYYTDDILLTPEGGQNAIMIEAGTLSTGELCYTINSKSDNANWRQTLGTDAYPVPFEGHGVVYANGNLSCDGTPSGVITYSNTESETVRAEHQYDTNGICSVCGGRLISTGDQLKAVADAINNGEIEGNILIDLANDIDLAGINYQGIGTRFNEPTGENDEGGNPITRDVKRPFTGTFDGHGYTVKNMIIEDMEGGNKGLIGLANGATIKNVLVDNTCEIYTIGWSAGIVGTACGRNVLTIENCGSDAMVNVGVTGANGAGILGVNDGSEAYVRIINCYNTGLIVGQRECGGISGWLGDNFEVVNCYNIGEVTPEAIDGIKTFARYNGNNAEFPNCYELDGTQVLAIEADDVTSGKLCYLLNEGAGKTIYYQTLGEDEHPVLDSTHKMVYSDGNGNYSNNESDGIESVTERTANFQGCYDLQGRHLTTTVKGQINIVRMNDGSVRKVMVK